MKNKKNIIIVLFVIFIIAGYLKFAYYINRGVKFIKNVGLTVYEQNSDNNFPKTIIEIPKHNGYLVAVYKDEHKLKLYKNNNIIREYDVNIRREYIDRQSWEDEQTPEGIFQIETMDIVTNGWSRWMRLDTTERAIQMYIKNHKDGSKIIKEFETEFGKILGDKEIRHFNELNRDKEILRGIGIHGGGFSLYYDWTRGCIAMNDKDAEELFGLLEQGANKGIGALVVIQD